MRSNICQSSKFLIVILLIASIMIAHTTEANSVAEATGRELSGRRMISPPPSPVVNHLRGRGPLAAQPAAIPGRSTTPPPP